MACATLVECEAGRNSQGNGLLAELPRGGNVQARQRASCSAYWRLRRRHDHHRHRQEGSGGVQGLDDEGVRDERPRAAEFLPLASRCTKMRPGSPSRRHITPRGSWSSGAWRAPIWLLLLWKSGSSLVVKEVDPTHYRRLICAAHSPDLVFAVGFVSKFMERPTMEHHAAVKLISSLRLDIRY